MKRKILFSLICIMMILAMGQESFAAIEIVPSKNGTGKDSIINTTISNSYLLCENMKETGGSLKGTTVSPHLATNKDWGAVSYLSNSIYGTNTTGGDKGVVITIDGVKYYSTTTNITGVMNWGSNPNVTRYTQTAGLISSYDDSTSTASSYITEIYANKDTRYVEIIGDGYSDIGMALWETRGALGSYYSGTNNDYPVSIRMGLGWANIGRGEHMGSSGGTGNADSYVTFRPVIWN